MDEMLEPIVDAVSKNLSKAGNVLTTEGLKRQNAEKKAISDGKIAVTQTATQLLTDKMKETGISEEYAKKALINELETIVNKRSILDKIFGRAKNIIQTTPQEDNDPNRDVGKISDDWLNRFRESACQKSSEEAQELFSKVLAGEIRKSGSFSLKALTALSDMDQTVAMCFKAFCSLCLVYLADPNLYHLTQSKSHFKIKDARIPIIKNPLYDGPAAGLRYKDDLSKAIKDSELIYTMFGLRIEEFTLLIEHNLILDNTKFTQDNFWYNDEFWQLTSPGVYMPPSSEDRKSVVLPGYALTHVGKELYRIVDFKSPPEYWERISVFLKNYYDINLYKIPKPRKKPAPDRSADQNKTRR